MQIPFVIHRSTIQLLRFHFSFFLLPVFLFALAELPLVDMAKAWLVFIILHLLVYPSSNGYNSYMDRDETPIGGLKRPMMPSRQLFRVTVIMDILAILLSLVVSVFLALGILLYILASRAYSYRKIRLKRFPVTGFVTVFFFQGAWIFMISYHAMHPGQPLSAPLLPALISSLLIGALYPLSQVYQHEEDQRDGVTTISYLLGKRGSFIFSMLLFLAASSLMFLHLRQASGPSYFIYYLLFLLPVVLFFLYWMARVWRNGKAASFGNSLVMNLVATACTSAFFITLIFLRK